MIDEKHFEKIDVPWKAYFLGWIFADGHLARCRNCIRMYLAKEDRSVIDYFNSKLYSGQAPLGYRAPYDFVSPTNKKTYRGQAQYGLSIYRKKICKDLRDKGLTSRKSLVLDFPDSISVPNHLIGHFIRGYFEGDGTVRASSGGRMASVSILGSLLFLSKLKVKLKSFGILANSPRKTSNTIYALDITKCDEVCRFANLIYRDADFYLERKKSRFDALFISKTNAHLRNRTSAFLGVNYVNGVSGYMARAMYGGRRYYLGHYKTQEEAALVRVDFLQNNNLYVEKLYD